MAQRVHLHIGTMKSATTYLQDLCELHLDELAAAGVLWPSGLVRYAAIRSFFGRANEHTDPPAAWENLLARIQEHPGDVVLSNELLAGMEAKRAGRLLEAFSSEDVHVVLTARDPARVIPSAWQTAIRNGEKTYSWAEFSSSVCSNPRDPSPKSIHARFWRQHDVARVIRAWQPHLGSDRVTVVTVPPPGGDPQAVARRFGTAIGVDLTALTPPTTRGNSSLGAHSAELIRRVSLAIPEAAPVVHRYGIRSALADSALSGRANLEPEFGLSAEQHAWAVERASRMVAELRTMDLRVAGDLTDLIPTPVPSAGGVDPGDTTEHELLQVALHGLAGMARHTARNRLECNQLRAEIERVTAERDALLKAIGPRSTSVAPPPRVRKPRETVRRTGG